LAQSGARQGKERGMRRRKLKALWQRLGEIQKQDLTRDQRLEKLGAMQLLDVRVPTTDGRELLLVRRTEPERDVELILARLNFQLPPQASPRISLPKAH
jgi:hypothetical protein